LLHQGDGAEEVVLLRRCRLFVDPALSKVILQAPAAFLDQWKQYEARSSRRRPKANAVPLPPNGGQGGGGEQQQEDLDPRQHAV